MNRVSKRKRILFVSSFTPPLNAGSGRNAYNFASFLADKGQRVSLLSLNRKGRLARREYDNKVKIIRLLYFNCNLLTKFLSLIIILPGYLYYVAKNDLVFIYGGNIIAFEFLILFGKILNKKTIFRSTMYPEDDIETLINQRWIGILLRFTLKQITVYYSINPAFSSSFERVYGSRNKVFESVQGVDTSRFFQVDNKTKTQLRKKLNLPEDIFIIVSVGYLIERKGFRNIFGALKQLELPFLYVVIGDYHVSDDHYLKHFNQEMIELFQLGKSLLKDKLIFTGSKLNIDEYLKASDIFILNSAKEGFPPNSIMEAMACGLPTIVRDIHGVDGFFTARDKNIIVTSGKSNDIRIYLKTLLSNTQLWKKIGKDAAMVIQKQASYDILWNRLKAKLNIDNG